MAYQPRNVPSDPAQLPDFLRAELQRLQLELNSAHELLRLSKSFNAPVKPRSGDVRHADGTGWDPGAGEGLYWYVDESWVRVGASGLEWVDIDFSIVIRTTGAGIPSLTTVQDDLTAPQWQVNDLNMCESQEFIHGWVEGSRVYWHLHLITNGSDGTDRYVAFEVEYAWANVNGQLSTTATIASGDLLIPANTPTKTMLIMPLGSFVPTDGRIGGHVLARLKRVAASGTAPGSDPWVPMLQLHIQVNTTGSAAIGTKWVQNETIRPHAAEITISGSEPGVTIT